MVVEILKAAKDQITAPEKWTKGEMARAANGAPVKSNDPDAECFCSLGAMASVSKSYRQYLHAEQVFSIAIGCRYIDDWNDAPERTHAEVMAAFDRAIQVAGEDA